jgi:hypothetical protein
MVVQKTIDSLKEKPHEEKKVVAGGIAVAVVLVLLIGWGFLFLRKIQKGTMPTLQTNTVPVDQFDANFLRETQQQINELYQDRNPLDELRDMGNLNNTQGVEVQTSPSGDDPGFGAEESAF